MALWIICLCSVAVAAADNFAFAPPVNQFPGIDPALVLAASFAPPPPLSSGASNVPLPPNLQPETFAPPPAEATSAAQENPAAFQPSFAPPSPAFAPFPIANAPPPPLTTSSYTPEFSPESHATVIAHAPTVGGGSFAPPPPPPPNAPYAPASHAPPPPSAPYAPPVPANAPYAPPSPAFAPPPPSAPYAPPSPAFAPPPPSAPYAPPSPAFAPPPPSAPYAPPSSVANAPSAPNAPYAPPPPPPPPPSTSYGPPGFAPPPPLPAPPPPPPAPAAVYGLPNDAAFDETLYQLEDGTVITDAENSNGGFKFSYLTPEGSSRSEIGEAKQLVRGQPPVIVVRGSYGYKSPDGRNIRVQYTADENGFNPREIAEEDDTYDDEESP